MRGGCAFYFRNRCAPTYRALASACSPAPTTRTILNSGLGFPPQALLKGGFLTLCFPSQFCIKCAFHNKPHLDAKQGFQQTIFNPSHPVRVARSFQRRQLWVTENPSLEALHIETGLNKLALGQMGRRLGSRKVSPTQGSKPQAQRIKC